MNAQNLQDVLSALETMQEMMEYEENSSRTRSYVREEHVPFLDSRFRNLDSYIASQNPKNFAHFTRLFPSEFQELYERLGPYLQHEPFHAAPISGQRRLFVYLRFVGHGYAYGALAEELNIGRKTVSDIVSEVTDVINTVLFANAFPPITRHARQECAMKTQQRYDYPRAVGFMDGKHVGLRKPRNAGSKYWNYKGFHSIILLAVCDCDYRLTAIDIGAAGRAGDAGVFRDSEIKTFYEAHDEVFPETTALDDVGPVQYHILVDGGFAQSHRYIRPFPEPMATTASKRRFNEKLSGQPTALLSFTPI
ncbi:unnamed protein product [Cylicocyclus nassatus]|uniref:DDE Tnp4 domain-containing protein n=1 Tax=Cylicocyclus nassatus TaxID=53992 RepID=A0AA36M291_CYLNA|nr:unnamed protein product [Cylicocyclus nassatus]